ncbi:MAG: accessory gene regulator B family protein, partial [Bacilli bacterium]
MAKTTSTNKVSLNEWIALKLIDKLTVDKPLNNIDYLKCKYAIENIIMNVSKMIVVYTIAFILNIGYELFIFHIGYMLIRTFGYGAHARNSWICLISSTIIFIASPFLITNYSASSQYLYNILSITNIIIILRYAPSFTMKNRI